jgi:hypothetical protein
MQASDAINTAANTELDSIVFGVSRRRTRANNADVLVAIAARQIPVFVDWRSLTPEGLLNFQKDVLPLHTLDKLHLQMWYRACLDQRFLVVVGVASISVVYEYGYICSDNLELNRVSKLAFPMSQ